MSEKVYPKVLVIGHNVFCKSTAFGKTLCSFFNGWDKTKLAELYFHSEIPTTDICVNYYRITDTDVLKSVFTLNKKDVGTEFCEVVENPLSTSPRTDRGLKRKIYEYSRKRTSTIYIARNLMWSLSGWYSKRLKEWLDAFNPDVIFFASGDYAFAYKVAYRISVDRNIPIITYCCDDYYINPLNPKSLLSPMVHKNLMKNVNRCISRSTSIITICKEMAVEYEKLFNKKITVLYTGYSTATNSPNGYSNAISYLGNLGYDRYKSLVEIGQAIRELKWNDGSPIRLDVYSTESRPHIIKQLTLDNGIIFHGAVSQNEVNQIIKNSLMVIHTESFDAKNIKKVKFSISTKVADLLASGTCILAYGPEDVASIKHLKENNAALVITDRNRITEPIRQIIEQPEQRIKMIQNALALAQSKHSPAVVTAIVYDEIQQSCKIYDE